MDPQPWFFQLLRYSLFFSLPHKLSLSLTHKLSLPLSLHISYTHNFLPPSPLLSLTHKLSLLSLYLSLSLSLTHSISLLFYIHKSRIRIQLMRYCETGSSKSYIYVLEPNSTIQSYKGSRNKSFSTNGQAIKALTPPPRSSLIAIGGTFFAASLNSQH